MSEKNKAMARRLNNELASKGDLSLADELSPTDFVEHNPSGIVRKLVLALKVSIILAVISLFVGVAVVSAKTSVSKSTVNQFQAAGDVGGGVLVPGTFFPPTTHGHGILQRGSDWIQVEINTSGLPEGAYTVWWVIFNNPDGCIDGCDGGDLFNPAAEVSVFWATGGVVNSNGVGNFVDRYTVGEDLGVPREQLLIGDGSLDPMIAEVHNPIKYHGPASAEPEVLYDQTHTAFGSCEANANAVGFTPFGATVCFDPQGVAFLP